MDGTAAPCPWRPSQLSFHGGPAGSMWGCCRRGPPTLAGMPCVGGGLWSHKEQPPCWELKAAAAESACKLLAGFFGRTKTAHVLRQNPPPPPLPHRCRGPSLECESCLHFPHELCLLTPPAKRVSSQAPRHAAKRPPAGPPSAGAGAPPGAGGWRAIPPLMGFLGAGTCVSSPLKIAEEAGCQVLFLPCLLFKGPCEIFIKINEDRQPAASPVPVRVQRTMCAVPVSLAEGTGSL